MQQSFTSLLKDIRNCHHCEKDLPYGPRPVIQAQSTARLRIIGQAPGRKVHETGIPWNDPSGVRLREWLGLSPAQFYNSKNVAITPMGFCYPGTSQTGDLPPRPECAELWHARLTTRLRHVKLTLLIGEYAQAYYLKNLRKRTLQETVKAWEEYRELGIIPMPHPSPRNRRWLTKNPWFEAELVPIIRSAIEKLEI